MKSKRSETNLRGVPLVTILVLFSLVLAGEGRKILESAGVSTSLALMLFGSHRT